MNSDSQQLLRQVRVLDPASNTDSIGDVLIAEGKIQAIATHLETFPPETTIIEAQGSLLAPALVDLYSHSGEPGREERETLASLAAAAAAGGFSRVAILPDTIPPLDNLATLALLRQQVPSFPQLNFWASLTLDLQGQQMVELADLVAAGAIGFAQIRPMENLGLLRRLLEYLKPLNKPIALVPTNETLQGNGVMREGFESIRFGLPGNPAISESTAIAAILELVAEIGTPVHLMKVSTRRGVELIAQAKERGVPVTASTSWIHLLLNTEAVGSYDTNLRLEPPLGNESDRRALLEGVKQGVIDAIATDHNPYTYEEKTLAFAEAPAGTIGLEFALPLLWEGLVATGECSALQLWQALSLNPQRCLNQPPLSCRPGEPAELVLFNPRETWLADAHTLKSRSRNSSWLGKTLTGRVLKVWG